MLLGELFLFGLLVHKLLRQLCCLEIVTEHFGNWWPAPVSDGPGSVVGIVTGYVLDGLGIESRWGARFSAPVQTGPGAHPVPCTIGTGSFLGVKSGQSVTLTPYSLLVPWSWKSRAIPLFALWAVRPVQSLSAGTVELYLYSPYGPYGLYRASVPVQ
jgi:hypothetical protein